MEEKWRPVLDYECLYEVSNFGRIKSKDRLICNCKSESYIRKGKILKPWVNSASGYLMIGLHKNKKRKLFYMHRIVAQVFIKNLGNKGEINHIDGNKTNNNVENLEWVTRSENQLHAIQTGLANKPPHNNTTKKIEQLDVAGNVVHLWNSCKEIYQTLGIPKTCIYECCANKIETSHGYKWRYKKESVNNLQRAN